MQISTKFTIAIHVLAATAYFGEKGEKVTSDFLAASVGNNPVIIRNIMGQLKTAGLIEVKRGPGGLRFKKPVEDITFLDVYDAVETNSDHLFHFHENPNPACPVGSNIHKALDGELNAIQDSFREILSQHKVIDVIKNIETYAA